MTTITYTDKEKMALKVETKEEEEEIGYCGSCETELDYMRDGTDTNGHRCSDCYWAEEPQHRRVTVVEYIDKNK